MYNTVNICRYYRGTHRRQTYGRIVSSSLFEERGMREICTICLSIIIEIRYLPKDLQHHL